VGGDRGDRQTDIFSNWSPFENSKLSPQLLASLRRDKKFCYLFAWDECVTRFLRISEAVSLTLLVTGCSGLSISWNRFVIIYWKILNLILYGLLLPPRIFCTWILLPLFALSSMVRWKLVLELSVDWVFWWLKSQISLFQTDVSSCGLVAANKSLIEEMATFVYSRIYLDTIVTSYVS